MVYYPKSEYKFVRFEKSNTKHKKYDAIIKNKLNDREKRLPFGDVRYQHYKDSTGLKLYSYLDHNDVNRRRLYRARHKQFIKDGYHSPSFYSYYYLW